MTKNMTNTACLIREFRTQKKLTQDVVARKLKIYVQQFSAIERGVSPCPLPIAKTLCDILEINPVNFRTALVADFANKLTKKWKS